LLVRCKATSSQGLLALKTVAIKIKNSAVKRSPGDEVAM